MQDEWVEGRGERVEGAGRCRRQKKPLPSPSPEDVAALTAAGVLLYWSLPSLDVGRRLAVEEIEKKGKNWEKSGASRHIRFGAGVPKTHRRRRHARGTQVIKMEARAKKAYASKLSLLRQEKRIDSPLVRYNELDQPVCKVCNVPVKSESAWPAHQISRKHQEAVNSIKARAAVAPSSASASAPGSASAGNLKIDSPVDERVPKARPSSSLPADFFDKQEAKRPNTGSKGRNITPQLSVKPVDSQSLKLDGERPSLLSNKSPAASMSKDDEGDKATVGRSDTNEGKAIIPGQQLGMVPKTVRSSEAKQAKGALPEGFFDNKDADLRARGIEPVKVDIKEEYKEFQKVIQEDLQEFDDRLEEEEFDAAEWREATDYLEQKTYMERVDMLKKNLEERRAAKFNTQRKRPTFMAGESSEESSSEGEDEEEETLDWRAKHL